MKLKTMKPILGVALIFGPLAYIVGFWNLITWVAATVAIIAAAALLAWCFCE